MCRFTYRSTTRAVEIAGDKLLYSQASAPQPQSRLEYEGKSMIELANMEIAVHKGFIESLLALHKDGRRSGLEALSKMQARPTSPGLQPEKIVNGFISLRATRGIRIIAQQIGHRLVLLHVDRHDPAFQWAERHSLLSDTTPGVWITSPESVISQAATPHEPTPYGDSLTQRLLTNLIPTDIASPFGECQNDDDMLDSLQSMSPQWQEVILEVAIGQAPSPDSTLTQPTNAAYLQWVKAHPNGFVVNAPRQRGLVPLKLHFANCIWISKETEQAYVGPTQYKVCSEDKQALVTEMNQQGKLELCGVCQRRGLHL